MANRNNYDSEHRYDRGWERDRGYDRDRGFDYDRDRYDRDRPDLWPERGWGGTRREAGGGGFETWEGRGNYGGSGGPGYSGRGDQGSFQGQGGGMPSPYVGSGGYTGAGWAGGMGAGYTRGGTQFNWGAGMGEYGYRQSGRYAGRGPKNYVRSDERIREDVNERLTQHPDIDASEIDVEVHSCEVTLKGTVDERHAKRLAEDIAESVFGVKEVHNQLRIGSPENASTEHSPVSVGRRK